MAAPSSHAGSHWRTTRYRTPLPEELRHRGFDVGPSADQTLLQDAMRQSPGLVALSQGLSANFADDRLALVELAADTGVHQLTRSSVSSVRIYHGQADDHIVGVDDRALQSVGQLT